MLRNNEKEFVTNIVSTKVKPNNVAVSSLFKYLARYYYEQCKDMTATEFTKFLLEKIKEYNLDIIEYEEYKYYSFVKRICEKMKKGEMRRELIDIPEVAITKEEIKQIQKADGWQKQKIMFTLYVLAKLCYKPTGWINNTTREIFELANVGISLEKRDYMLHDLYAEGLIDFRKGVDRSGIFVKLEPSDEAEVIVRRFDNIGNQYLAKYKDGWTICKICGRMVRLNGEHDHSRKYCKKCSENIKNHAENYENFKFF